MSNKVTSAEKARYDEISRLVSDVKVDAQVTGSPLTGDAATQVGREFLLSEYGSERALEEAMRPGRPQVDGGYGRGQSKEIRGRITATQLSAIALLKQRTGKTESQLVRDAVDALIRQEHLA